MPSMREYRLPFAVLGAPVTFVERGVGRACCRTGAFLNLYTMKMIGVLTRVLAQAAALVRTIHVVREEFAVPGRLAYRLAGLRGQRAIGKARRATAAALVRHARTTSGELMIEVDVVIALGSRTIVQRKGLLSYVPLTGAWTSTCPFRSLRVFRGAYSPGRRS